VPLPINWEEQFDDRNNRPVYVDMTRHLYRWERPVHSSDTGMMIPLPEGWTMHTLQATKQTVYIHSTRGVWRSIRPDNAESRGMPISTFNSINGAPPPSTFVDNVASYGGSPASTISDPSSPAAVQLRQQVRERAEATLANADKRQKPQHAKDVPLGDINRDRRKSDAASKRKSKRESDMAIRRGLDTRKNDGAENPDSKPPSQLSSLQAAVASSEQASAVENIDSVDDVIDSDL